MNTADRSVEALDTALRRRFSFVEMPPKPGIIKDIQQNNGILTIDNQAFNLAELLEKINDRIEILLDRDHLIGHSYFLNISSPGDLKRTFSKQIIPLLQEYFYGDYGKISLVIGEGFCSNKKIDDAGSRFAQVENYDTDVFSEKIIYVINDPLQMDDSEFKDALLKME